MGSNTVIRKYRLLLVILRISECYPKDRTLRVIKWAVEFVERIATRWGDTWALKWIDQNIGVSLK
jgi:hypothetical protein